ncbi:hypothetical protein KYY02_21305 [Streptomyces pimonensis]|uniref:Uncharacterized protein n=1 Tax=Streptomyces pimonensis TaxID=2860288 RepID=A0ABV4J2M3_9ACTN
MINQSWCDDSDYQSTVEQFEKITQVVRKAIAAAPALMSIAAITVAVLCLTVDISAIHFMLVVRP